MVHSNNHLLLKELEDKFNQWRKDSQFNISLDELDEIFFIRDYILSSKFVTCKISRMICSRIVDTFNGWIQQIHSWLIPSPYSMISTSENQLFNDEEKEELNKLLKEFRAFVSENIIIALTKDKRREANFVDTSVIIWKKNISKLIKYCKKINDYWKSEIQIKNK